jgi:hypothetical protein
VLLALRANSINNLPDYYDYLDDFVNAGWTISGISVLGNNNLHRGLPISTINPLYELNSKKTPSNEIAHRLRNAWNWL